MRPGGVVEIFGPDGVTTLYASTCAHCNGVTNFPSTKKMHEHVEVCRSCMKLICLECAGKPCRPWQKEMERQEAVGRMLRDIGL